MAPEATAKVQMGISQRRSEPGVAAGHTDTGSDGAACMSKRGHISNYLLAREAHGLEACEQTQPTTGREGFFASPEDSQWPENVTEGFGVL